ncbi:MAG TPA: hypothetical protein VFA26_18845 [Gemmataceae bacterium]|nr:hypothetical protein [Gemmataceae bacterium]
MSLFGKVLVFLNALAALAFVCLAALDYGQRTAWSYAVHRHELALNGLPLDEKELDVDGHPRYLDICERTQRELFGGQPVRTQAEEVQRVQGRVQGIIDGSEPLEVIDPLDFKKGKVKLTTRFQKLAWVLLPLAPDESQREQLMARIRDDKNTSDKLEGEKQTLDEMLAAPFNAALQGPNPGKPDPDARRHATAHLLLALSDVLQEAEGGAAAPAPGQPTAESPAYKRALAVVGLREATRELDRQSAQLGRMTDETSRSLLEAHTQFAIQHRRLLDRLEDMAEDVQLAKDFLDAQQNLLAQQQVIVNERQKQVQDLQNQLAAAQKQTRAKLDELDRMQRSTFDAQVRLRDANKQNQYLESELRKLEVGGEGKKP